MRDKTSLLGINMAQRGNRRWLVALVYLMLFTLWGLSLAFSGQGNVYNLALLYASLLVNFVVFGGYGRWGLIKPFNHCRTSGAAASAGNDERELRRRDHMHFYAYRVVLIALMIGYALTIDPHWHPQAIRAFIVGIAAIGLTLPQAMLLWGEPDLEDADAVL